jgi:hypothetical protein
LIEGVAPVDAGCQGLTVTALRHPDVAELGRLTATARSAF